MGIEKYRNRKDKIRDYDWIDLFKDGPLASQEIKEANSRMRQRLKNKSVTSIQKAIVIALLITAIIIFTII